MSVIEIRESAFDPYQLLGEFNRKLDMKKSGACVNFIGSMRDFNEGDSVVSMYLEYYPGMTEKALNNLSVQARSQWSLNELLLIHRVGEIKPAEAIVLVATWSTHRADAFSACRFLIDTLKTTAPFWKKEQLNKGSRWVDKNTV